MVRVTSSCTVTPLTLVATRPSITQPKFEYSKTVPGGWAKVAPARRRASTPRADRSIWRSAHQSSSGRPPAIVIRLRTVSCGESTVGSLSGDSSGTCRTTGSSRLRRPWSRSASKAAATNDLVIEQMREGVSGPGRAVPPTRASPTPPAWTTSPPATTA